MNTLLHPATGLDAWLHFVAFTVFPVAFGQLIHWLYEWQVLAAAVLVLVAAHVWGSAILKAARLGAGTQPVPARTSQRAATPGADLREKRPAAMREEMAFETSVTGDTGRLGGLRREIRMMLGSLPCTDDPLSAHNRALCARIGSFELPASLEGAEDLRGALGTLAALRDDTTNRTAWAALVRLSTAARDLLEGAKEADNADIVDWDGLDALRRRRQEG